MARLVAWEPLREVATVHNEMSRLMNGLLEGNGRTTQSWVPAVDVWETEGEIVYAFDLPGVPQDRIDVEVDDGTLTVRAERERSDEVENERFYRSERRWGTFTRTLGLPQGATDEHVTATFEQGVLEVHVRKPEAPKPRRIQIGVEQPATIDGTAADG